MRLKKLSELIHNSSAVKIVNIVKFQYILEKFMMMMKIIFITLKEEILKYQE